MNKKKDLTMLQSIISNSRFIKSNLGVADNLDVEKYHLLKDKLIDENAEIDK